MLCAAQEAISFDVCLCSRQHSDFRVFCPIPTWHATITHPARVEPHVNFNDL